MGKEPLAELKLAIFKNCLDTRLKMEMHDPNVYPTILGCFARFLEIWELKVPFSKSKKFSF